MENLSGAQMVVKSLINLNIKYIFGYPGGAVLDIYDALYKIKGINHILVRHEQAAVHMADGYSRATGKIGVVLVTSGPGATNAITGIATAYMDSIPLIIISGQVASSLIGLDAFQECDMIGISRPIVKHSFLVKNPEDIPIIFKKAFWIASTGRPGPVVIDLPKDIQNSVSSTNYYWPESINIRSYNPTTSGHKKQIIRALKILKNAKRPIIYAGGGIISSNASNELLLIAEKLNIPVTTSLMGLGVFPSNHLLSLKMLGMHGTYEANMAMHHSDVILAIGVRFDDRTTNNLEKYCPNAIILHIDIDPTSISKTVFANIPIVGNAKNILQQMLQLIKNKQKNCLLQNWWNQINHWKKTNSLKYNINNLTIKPQTVIQNIWKLTNGNAYVTSDVGQHQMFTALYYSFNKPRQWINSGGLGTMGFGLPAALGVKLAHPKGTVICITGDGSIQMNLQELSTAKQYNLSIIIINLNNSSLGMVKQWQDIHYKSRYSHSYMNSLPNFIKLAEAYGHVGISITNPTKLYVQLEEAFLQLKKEKLVFVDIIIDPSENVFPMQIKEGGMNEMQLRPKKIIKKEIQCEKF